jgi:hypothetical protein
MPISLLPCDFDTVQSTARLNFTIAKGLSDYKTRALPVATTIIGGSVRAPARDTPS